MNVYFIKEFSNTRVHTKFVYTRLRVNASSRPAGWLSIEFNSYHFSRELVKLRARLDKNVLRIHVYLADFIFSPSGPRTQQLSHSDSSNTVRAMNILHT